MTDVVGFFRGPLTQEYEVGQHVPVNDVAPNLLSLRVAMNGEDDGSGKNDFDLFVIRGPQADLSKAVCSEAGLGQFAFCEIAQPEPGPWTIVVRRKKGEGFAQVSVTQVLGRATQN